MANLGNTNTSSAPKTQTVFHGLIDNINEHINAIVDRQQVAVNAINRLRNPVPIAAVSSKDGAPSNGTVESDLRCVLLRLESVHAEATAQADDLNCLA